MLVGMSNETDHAVAQARAGDGSGLMHGEVDFDRRSWRLRGGGAALHSGRWGWYTYTGLVCVRYANDAANILHQHTRSLRFAGGHRDRFSDFLRELRPSTSRYNVSAHLLYYLE
jgi:hypothetical protein